MSENLQFTPSDFAHIYRTDTAINDHNETIVKFRALFLKTIADTANAILAAKLARAPVLHSTGMSDIWFDHSMNIDGSVKFKRRARAVCIEDLP